MPAQSKRKKWTKGKIKEKSNNAVLIDRDGYEKIIKEVCKNKLLTPSNLTDRFHITVSLAKNIFSDLCDKKVLKSVDAATKKTLYTKN